MNYNQTADEIYKAVGGNDNIINAAHCATRLRLVIADNNKCRKSALENIDGVKGVFEAAGQLQIIIGTGTVNKVYDKFIKIAKINGGGTNDVNQDLAISLLHDKAKEKNSDNLSDMMTVHAENEISSPLEGKLVKLNEVDDATFASGVLGKGVAIEPSGDAVISPMSGRVATLFDTKHAIGLELDNGAELLVHIGINTVELNGEGYAAHVKEGDSVKRGQQLITFDKELIERRGYKAITPVIITNSDNYFDIEVSDKPEVKTGERLISIIRENINE